MVTINIQKKDLFLLSAIMIFLIAVGYVVAYNPSGTGGTPSIMGHSFGELELPACAAGQILKYSGGIWGCGVDIDTDTNTVFGLVTGWARTSTGVCDLTWGTASCGGGTVSCSSGNTLRSTGERTTGGGYYICVRN